MKFSKISSFKAAKLVYVQKANFGLLEDKLKQIKKAAFERVDYAKGDASKPMQTNLASRYNLFNTYESGATDYQISAMNLDQLIDRLKKGIDQKEISSTFYYKMLERFQEIVIDEPDTTGRSEILRILRVMNYYRPKDEERIQRQARDRGYVGTHKENLSTPHLKQIKKIAMKTQSPVMLAFDHIKEHVKIDKLKGMLTDYSYSQDDAMSKDIYDVIEVYK